MARRITATLAAALATVLLWTSPVATSAAEAKSPYPPKTLATSSIDAHPGYDPQSRCTPTAKPGTKALLSLLIKTWGGGSSGISRGCNVGGTSEHKEGRALDWHMDMKSKSQRARVDKALAWITANNGEVARRLGIMYVIWNQRIWSTYYPELGWRKMASRGSYTANHKNHVHISLTWDGAMKQTSWWTGVPVTTPLYYKCGVSGQPACLRTIARAGSTKWPYQSTTVPASFLPAPRNYPNIGGSPRVGLTLTAVPGTWVPDGATLTYQWQRNKVPIPGATASTYQLVAADYNKVIRVKVTATAGAAVIPPKTSAGTAEIYRGKFSASAVRLSGNAVVGTTLGVNLGTWSPAPSSYGYQWLRDGKVIKGQTAATYLPKASDAGHRLSVRITGKLAGYTDLTVTTATLKVLNTFSSTPAPVISGTVSVGSTLSASVPAWTPAASLRYQWYAGDAAIAGATSSSLVITEAQTGLSLRVVVTGSRSGYGSVQVSSALTGVVTAAAASSPPESPAPAPSVPPSPAETPSGG